MTMSIAPSSSTSHEMDEDLCLFFLHDLDIAPSFVNAIDPVICIMQNLSNLYDIGQMDLLDLMHWCMENLPAIGHDESWMCAYSEDLHRMFALSEYIANGFCPLDVNNVGHEPMMETLKALTLRDFDFYFARSYRRFISKFSLPGNVSRNSCVFFFPASL